MEDFNLCLQKAKEKIALKLWNTDFAKGYLSCIIDEILNISDDAYDECANKIDEL